MYEKVYIIKPNTSNIITYEKYIVCKNFILNEDTKEIYENYYTIFLNFLNTLKDRKIDTIKDITTIISIIDYNIPSYFINKINDINIIIGQQQLEYLNQIILLLQNKNKDSKLEIIKKINIQKSINWCEKNKLPHNKILEKSNIFLNDKIESS